MLKDVESRQPVGLRLISNSVTAVSATYLPSGPRNSYPLARARARACVCVCVCVCVHTFAGLRTGRLGIKRKILRLSFFLPFFPRPSGILASFF